MNRRFRLNKRTDFERVRRTGKSYAHPLIVLVALHNELPITRIGISAGRSVGGAVKRNLAKRRIRACVSQHLPQLSPGYDLVFLARTAINEQSHQELSTAITRLLQRANLKHEAKK